MVRKSGILNISQEMVQAYAVNERMNQFVLEHLDPRAWRTKPPNGGRTICAIFTHVHNIRRKWLRLSAAQVKLPTELDRTRCTQKQARKALADSAARCYEMLAKGLDAPDDWSFLRDGWARPWRPGAAMFAYMITHDAHHRGQVCLIAHQLGFPLPPEASQAIWGWEKLWNECGFGSLVRSRGEEGNKRD